MIELIHHALVRCIEGTVSAVIDSMEFELGRGLSTSEQLQVYREVERVCSCLPCEVADGE